MLFRGLVSTPSSTSRRPCAKREIGIEPSPPPGGGHRPDLSGRGRVGRRAPRSYANLFQQRGSLGGVDAHVRFGAAAPRRRRVLGTDDRRGPRTVLRLSRGG